MDAREAARHFVECEREFHLGVLPTEQSHPRTRGFAEVACEDACRGIQMLQAVDRDVAAAAARAFRSEAFEALVVAMRSALTGGGRICFSGCGATGRLSILLEAAWRSFCRDVSSRPDLREAQEARPDAVISIMTGGDYALVRSVEYFEDYPSFGRQQAADVRLGPDDVLVAITEGGETSSVIGSAWQALDAGARVFFACNNPIDILAAHIARSREVIEDPRIVKLDLSSGPMAIAGSTRMQATTCELLVIGAALEIALMAQSRNLPSVEQIYCEGLARLLDDLGSPPAVDAMAQWAELEESAWRSGGAVTYFGNEYLLDIFTDTTERAPTFSLPPFRKCDDAVSRRPLAFVKSLFYDTPDAWRHMLGRQPRCLTWDASMYCLLGAGEAISDNPPCLAEADLYKFLIGKEDDPSRHCDAGDLAALVACGREVASTDGELGHAFSERSATYPARRMLTIGPSRPSAVAFEGVHIPCGIDESPLRLWEHLAIKLVLNTISTTTAARMGRVASNWMAHVETTNKKLVDRGTRLVSELGGLDYAEACYELHRTRHELAVGQTSASERISPVAATLARIRGRRRD